MLFLAKITSVLAISLLMSSLVTTTANAAMTVEEFEECLLDMINASRQSAGAVPLAMAYDLNAEARDYSRIMSSESDLHHMTAAERKAILPNSTTTWGENIAFHGSRNLSSCATIHNMFMGSTGHRNNILSSTKRFAALGVYMGSNGTWVTEIFFNATSYEAPGAEGEGLLWDDDGSVFEIDIEALAAAEVTSGCNPPTNNRYCPHSRVSRGQMAAFLVRAVDL